MKKIVLLGMGLCIALAFSSCKSSESAYKKAYEKAKQQELAEPQVETTTVAPVTTTTTAPVQTPKVVESAPVNVRTENVSWVSGAGLKDYSIVVGAFGVKANAEGLRARLEGEGYKALVVQNAQGLYRVIAGSYDDRSDAAKARDAFKAAHSGNEDFQKAWLLYRQ